MTANNLKIGKQKTCRDIFRWRENFPKIIKKILLCSTFGNYFFFAGVLVVNFVLPLEIVTPEWRTFCGCIGLWAVGLMALALWGYFIRDWQYLVIATSTASVFILLAWW